MRVNFEDVYRVFMLWKKGKYLSAEDEKVFLSFHYYLIRYVGKLSSGKKLWLPRETIEDIASSAMKNAFKCIRQFRGEEYTKFSGWLHKIAENELAQYLRDSFVINTAQSLDEKLFPVARLGQFAAQTQDLFKQIELRNCLKIAMRELNDDTVEDIVTLRLQGYTYEEVAKEVEVNLVTCRVRFLRCKRKARQVLQRR